MNIFERSFFIFLGAGFAMVLCAWMLYAQGLRINTTASIPLGFYKISNKSLEKGDYVTFCPPQKQVFRQALNRGYLHSGFCHGGFGHVMKKIVASTNDFISISSSGVAVNGILLAYSKPLVKDNNNLPLPTLEITNHQLTDFELLLMTDQSINSFDGRYFGLIDRKQIDAVIIPILTWN